MKGHFRVIVYGDALQDMTVVWRQRHFWPVFLLQHLLQVEANNDTQDNLYVITRSITGIPNIELHSLCECALLYLISTKPVGMKFYGLPWVWEQQSSCPFLRSIPLTPCSISAWARSDICGYKMRAFVEIRGGENSTMIRKNEYKKGDKHSSWLGTKWI